MSFTRVKPANWAAFETLTAAQMNQLDIDHANAVDGSGGGVYAPSSAIEIGGSGLVVSGAFGVTGVSTFSGDVFLGVFGADVQVDGPLTVNEPSTFNETVTVNDDVLVSDDITCLGNLEIQGTTILGNAAGDTVTANGNAIFNGTATFNGNVVLGDSGDLIVVGGSMACALGFSVDGNATIGNAAGDAHAFTGTCTFNDPIVLAGDGHVRKRVIAGADAASTYGVDDADIILLESGTLSAPRIYTIDNTSAGAGSSLIVVNKSTTQALTVNLNGGALSVTLQNTTGQEPWYEFVFFGGVWTIARFFTIA